MKRVLIPFDQKVYQLLTTVGITILKMHMTISVTLKIVQFPEAKLRELPETTEILITYLTWLGLLYLHKNK